MLTGDLRCLVVAKETIMALLIKFFFGSNSNSGGDIRPVGG